MLSDVMLGQQDLQFERRLLWYNPNKVLHDKLADFYIEYLSQYNDSYMIDMPLDDCDSYLGRIIDMQQGLMDDESLIAFLQSALSDLNNEAR